MRRLVDWKYWTRCVSHCCSLKEQLSRYDYVGHFHTKKSKEADFWAGESLWKELIEMLVKLAGSNPS